MKVFVLWRESLPGREEQAAERVGAELERLFAPLFSPAPVLRTRSLGSVHLAWHELPVKGFRPPFFEAQGERWALAPDYPLNARGMLREAKKEEELAAWQITHRFRKYCYHAYWEMVGMPLIQAALEAGGFWTELFDADRAREVWGAAKGYADTIAIAHLLPEVRAGR